MNFRPCICRNLALAMILISTLSACASGSFQQFGSSILSSTGLMSDSQASALFQAGGKLAKAASPLTEEQEYYLGRGVAAGVFAKYRPVRNDALQRYVNKVGRVVAIRSGRPEVFNGYHFVVLDTNEINAMAAPGGFIFVTSGLLGLLPNEDALAAVLAHEVAHVALAHGVKAISQANLTSAVSILGREAVASQGNEWVGALTETFGESITDVTDTLLTKGYSRSQEYAADAYAAELLGRAGYDARALLAVFAALEAHGKNHKDSSGWFSTHPDPDDRIDEVEDSVKKQPPPAAGPAVRDGRFRAALKR